MAKNQHSIQSVQCTSKVALSCLSWIFLATELKSTSTFGIIYQYEHSEEKKAVELLIGQTDTSS